MLAANSIRDEYGYPTPIVLEAKPTLVGYYRLLNGLTIFEKVAPWKQDSANRH